MAFYEFHLCCFLRSDTPLEVYHTLLYMIDSEKLNEPEYVRFSKAKIFTWSGWKSFLNRDIPHFPVINFSSIKQIPSTILNIHCSFLSSSNEIIVDFLDWIKPYCNRTCVQ